MDVSRIEAISPNKIDWRKLTAPEIIEFKEQGVEVPTLYLQWAQNFMNDVNSADKDETTYESAVSGIKSTKTTSDSTEEEKEPLYNTMSAAEYRAELREYTQQGMSYAPKTTMLELGIIFTEISKEKTIDSQAAQINADSVDDQGENTIEALESYMSNLLDRINSANEELNAEKNNKNDSNRHSKILRLSRKVKELGETGQNVLAGYGLTLENFQQLIEDEKSITASGLDYGSETIDISKNMPFDFHTFIHKIQAKRAGEKLVDKSTEAMDTQTDVVKSLDDKMSTVDDFKHQVAEAAGVGASSAAEIGANADSNGESSSESAKSSAVAQNDGTEQSEKASRTIDEILKAKIRRGENVSNDQLA